MDLLCYLGVYGDHASVEVGVIAHEDLWIPGSGDEEGGDAAFERGQEDVGNLEADYEAEGQDDGGVAATFVVHWLGVDEVQVGEEGTDVTDQGSAHGEDGIDETGIDQDIDATVFHHAVNCQGNSSEAMNVNGMEWKRRRGAGTYDQVSLAAGI